LFCRQAIAHAPSPQGQLSRQLLPAAHVASCRQALTLGAHSSSTHVHIDGHTLLLQFGFGAGVGACAPQKAFEHICSGIANSEGLALVQFRAQSVSPQEQFETQLWPAAQLASARQDAMLAAHFSSTHEHSEEQALLLQSGIFVRLAFTSVCRPHFDCPHNKSGRALGDELGPVHAFAHALSPHVHLKRQSLIAAQSASARQSFALDAHCCSTHVHLEEHAALLQSGMSAPTTAATSSKTDHRGKDVRHCLITTLQLGGVRKS